MPDLTPHEFHHLSQLMVGAGFMLAGSLLSLSFGSRGDGGSNRAWPSRPRLFGFLLLGYLLALGGGQMTGVLGPEGVAEAVFFGGLVFVGLAMLLNGIALRAEARRRRELTEILQARQEQEASLKACKDASSRLDRWLTRLPSGAVSAGEFFAILCDATESLVESDLVAVALVNRDGLTLEFPAVRGYGTEGVRGLRLPLTSCGVIRQVLTTAEPALLNDLRQNEAPLPLALAELNLASALVVPFRHRDEVAGALCSFRARGAFEPHTLARLEDFARRASSAYENLMLFCALDQRVTERTLALEEQNNLLEGIVSHIPSYVFWKTIGRVYGGCNEGFLELVGLKSPAEIVGRTDPDLPLSPELAQAIIAAEETVLKTGRQVLDREIRCQDARRRPLTCLLSLIPMKDGFGAVTGLLGILKDITARKEAETSQQKLNLALQTLSAGSAAIVHATSEQQLIAQMCRLVVEVGGYRLAWIGVLRDGDPGVLRQAGQYFQGQAANDACRTDVTLNGAGSSCELISRALLQGRYTLVRKGGADHWSKACRHLDQAPDYGAAIALPLIIDGRGFGVMALYASDPRAFDPDEVQLLCDLARNLAHGVGALRERHLRRDAEKALERERAFLQTVIDGVADPTLVITTDYRIILMNQASRAFLPDGQVSADLRCHQVIHRLEHPCGEEVEICPLHEVQRTGKSARVVHRHVLGDGRERTYEIEASPLWNADGSLRGIVQSARDISDRLAAEDSLRKNQERLDHLAHHDPLTNLPNRLLLNRRLGQALERSRAEDKLLALMFLDLDRFKKINDSLGHEIGDQVLREVSSRLQRCLRGTDIVARLGGDEFVVILEEVEDLKTVALVARNILRAMSRSIRAGSQELYCSTSIGISLYPGDADDIESLMKYADLAMYRAKEEGRNNYQFYRPEMNLRTHEMLVMESNLRRAMEENQLRVFYQPQFSLENQQLIGFEALLRWEHPEYGMVSPADFIPLAEETGLIVPLGQWVLHTACSQARAWQRQGYVPVRMAVNISAREFRQPDFVDNLDEILADSDLDPHWLELEITESIAMQNFEETIMTLTDLKIRGVHLAIDDFGTGYSSLGYLKRFPISKLKIDQSFVRDINRDSNDAAIAGSIIALGRSMNMEVIAEGVEREDQVTLLLEKGCHQGQGYLYSPAVPADKAEGFLVRKKSAARSTVIHPPQFSKNSSGGGGP